ncbi:hypothetical protein [Vibrio penaeicida]|uniref:Uncharacterized protein n=1 Tax=Vibrio penaeicida TaxID=104609 RepID=A0AAV5NQ50_9VIBR|nr:hypothetical protein [Vibrio penaeicida]RTZ21083.1 hypothetical protein EKN09_21115 [Vibrio penaeicida]GLQ72107.1 hypothetical protein GCM10007932_14670 [Vibrio penaeicida]
MTNLTDILASAGMNELTLSSEDQVRSRNIIKTCDAIFNQACQNNPEKSPFDMALGTLTKAQMELMVNIETQADTLKSMGDIIQNTLGGEHSDKFSAELPKDLLCCTRLWLMAQGYLQMDFSLANDHATQTSEALAKVENSDIEKTRTELMKAFYIGKSHNSVVTKHSVFSRVSAWLSKTFS